MIPVVDDDAEIRTLLARHLPGKVCLAQTAATRRETEARRIAPRLDLVMRDMMLPDAPGLEIGADDYLGNPFIPRDLVARIRSVLRRADPDIPAPPYTGKARN
ncbi:hypothetical protein [Gemmobacter sp. 24YEA27]|uniref:hypothetical protein n=1 Tax=Gemmobacter sp. 24YEA27 TaxID=3040672 RepID=UPI0024B36BA0|nr:hypothetical protein [Gemmobacter sp. 24YEA27]